MAKKYLLYIHIDMFDKEPNKSQLVNTLLRQHYEPAKPFRAQTLTEQVSTVKKIITAETCKRHGLPLQRGRTTCGIKDC